MDLDWLAVVKRKNRETERMEMRVKRKREETEQRDGWRVEVKLVAFRAIVAVNFFPAHSYSPLPGRKKGNYVGFYTSKFLTSIYILGKVVFGAGYLKLSWKSNPKIVVNGKTIILCLVPFLFPGYPFTVSMSTTFNVSMSAGYI